MKKKLVLSIAVVGAAFSMIGAAAPQSPASPLAAPTAQPAPSITSMPGPAVAALADPCKDAAANATGTLENFKMEVSVGSNGANYGSDEKGKCGSWVADFSLPANSKGPNCSNNVISTLADGVMTGVTKAQCPNVEGWVGIYKKIENGAFTRKAGGKLVGKWIPKCTPPPGGFCGEPGDRCALEGAAGYKTIKNETPATKASTYRIAVSVKRGATKLPVKAGISRQPNPC